MQHAKGDPHTPYPAPSHHSAPANLSRSTGRPHSPLPGRYLLNKFTPVVNRDLSPLLLLALKGKYVKFDLVWLKWGIIGEISPVFRQVVKSKVRRYRNNILMGIIFKILK